MIDAILREKAPEGFHGFLILDMDHFKEVNDVYGHVMGDNVLKMLGGFLKEQFREQDVIGRIGGDEFVIDVYKSQLLISGKATFSSPSLFSVRSFSSFSQSCCICRIFRVYSIYLRPAKVGV